MNPRAVEDSVARHPWVAGARVSRIPTGVVRVSVVERMPAAMVVKSGRPAYYLDEQARQLPLTPGEFREVPLIRGDTPEPDLYDSDPPPLLLRLVAALAGLPNNADDLISEITISDGSAALTTVPIGEWGPVIVLLGDDDFSDKLLALRAFYDQIIESRMIDSRPELIDLRFDSQIVLRNSNSGSIQDK